MLNSTNKKLKGRKLSNAKETFLLMYKSGNIVNK